MPAAFSLEIFPPKSDAAYQSLQESLKELAPLGPKFMTVTYGAGGTTKDKTKQIVRDMAAAYDFPVAAHLTAVGASRDEVLAIADDYWSHGIKELVVIRGDMPNGERYKPHPDGFAYTADMVKALMAQHDYKITVAAYAEGHPDSPSLSFDMDNLRRKLDNGAQQAITQFFFDPELYLRFRDRAVKAGITKPIIPGLLPVLNFDKTKAFAARCGAPIPNFLAQIFEGLEPTELNHKLFAMNVLSHQITRLAGEGVEHFHFYTLNETLLTRHICRWLQLGF
ncbi:MAG: methylenetetrahydrofolate reductase [Alphaproteobacteria bacterium]|nr:methylenetetrahydrofolate reductase [Alphaproteobacteria bacterium]MBU0860190.1 methylenetetrahydrofolate reductase [Alphaproteobacteria bacterium]